MKQKPHLIIVIILILAFFSIVFIFFEKNTANRNEQKEKITFTDKSEGFYSPVWSEDGTQIYFVKRDTEANVTSEPSLPLIGSQENANIIKETFQIIAQNFKTKQEQILMSTNSPRNGKSIPSPNINNIKADIKLNENKINLDYILSMGFGAKNYIPNYLSGNGQINIKSRISNIGKFIETAKSQKFSFGNLFAIKNNLELIAPRGNASVIVYDYNNKSITLFRKDKYGKFDQFYPQFLKLEDIKHFLKKQPITSNDNQTINNVIGMVPLNKF